MPTITPDARFLGVDLRSLGRELRQAWASLLQTPLLSWLTPEAAVLLLQADGGESLWWGDERQEGGAKAGAARFKALQLPEELLLLRTLALPPMDDADTASAVALQARAISPFAEPDLVWGWRVRPGVQGRGQIDVVLASRRQIAQYLQAQAQRLGGDQPEVWALPPTGAPIVLAGYGEDRRRAQGRRGRWLRYGLLGLALVFVAGIALTPTLQLRARAIEAVHAYDAVVLRTHPLVKERETLLQTVEQLTALSDLLAGRIEPLRVLERLTTVLPDDTALQGFTLKGQKLTLNGQTGNASALMQLLGQQPGMREVRAPSPATRAGGANSKENFVIELALDPQEFGVAVAPPQPLASPPAPAPVPSAVVREQAAPAPEANASAASIPAAARPPAPGANRAVFGGSPSQPAKPAPATPERKGTP